MSTYQPLVIPSRVKGMQTLDRSQFAASFDIPSVRLPTHLLGNRALCATLKPTLLKVPGIRAVPDVVDSDDTSKSVLLDPQANLDRLLQAISDNGGAPDCTLSTKRITIAYENWPATEILRAVLPEDARENITGYSVIGHIVHLNLKETSLPFKGLIAQVLLDKIQPARTVINKPKTISTQFRNFQPELLAGDADYVVDARENGCTYRFDFAKVYWNPRLGSEHMRLVELMNHNDVMYDMFAGVGPFAIPAARRKHIDIIANDLNPESYRWLCENVVLNRQQQRITTHNLDAVDFLTGPVRADLVRRIDSHQEDAELGMDPLHAHFVMNLPETADRFLCHFNGLLRNESWPRLQHVIFTVHLYVFHVESDELSDPDRLAALTRRVCARLRIAPDVVVAFSTQFVRKVAPAKTMWRLTFDLPPEVLLGRAAKSPIDVNSDEELVLPESKRLHISI